MVALLPFYSNSRHWMDQRSQLNELRCPIDQTDGVINPQSGPSTITNCAAHSEDNKQYLVRIFTDTFSNLQWIWDLLSQKIELY